MRKGLFLVTVGTWIVLSIGLPMPEAPGRQKAAATPTPSEAERYGAVVTKYCVTCHNERTKSGGLVLAMMDFANVAADAEVWEKVLRKLHLGAMPPPGVRRP